MVYTCSLVPDPQATPRFYLTEKNCEKAWDHCHITDRKLWTRLVRTKSTISGPWHSESCNTTNSSKLLKSTLFRMFPSAFEFTYTLHMHTPSLWCFVIQTLLIKIYCNFYVLLYSVVRYLVEYIPAAWMCTISWMLIHECMEQLFTANSNNSTNHCSPCHEWY